MKNIDYYKCLIFFLFFSQYFFSEEKYLRAQESSENKNFSLYQYKISLSSDIKRTQIKEISFIKINKKRKKRLKIETNAFGESVNKYDTFLVLSEDEKKIIAEIVITEKKRKQSKAFAKITHSLEDMQAENLVGRTIIQIEDLVKVIEKNSLYFNPYISVSVQRRQFISSISNVLTDRNINANALSLDSKIELFAPKQEYTKWLNWLGFRFIVKKISKLSLNIRRSKEDKGNSKINISGSSMHGEVIIQPWFEDFLINHFSLLIGVYNVTKDKFESEGNLLGDVSLSKDISRKYSSFGLEISLNPYSNFFVGFTGRMSLKHDISIKGSDQEEDVKAKWQEINLNAWGDVLFPIIGSFHTGLRVNITQIRDSISAAGSIPWLNDRNMTHWEYGLQFSLFYFPR